MDTMKFKGSVNPKITEQIEYLGGLMYETSQRSGNYLLNDLEEIELKYQRMASEDDPEYKTIRWMLTPLRVILNELWKQGEAEHYKELEADYE